MGPERLSEILSTLAARRDARSLSADERVRELERLRSETEDRLRHLYKLVEDGVSDLDDILKARIFALKEERAAAVAALERATKSNRPGPEIDAKRIETFGGVTREKLTTGAIPFRKAYLGAIIDKIEVDDDRIRIVCRKDVLEQALMADFAAKTPVRSFVRKWRARQELNLRPQD